MKLLGRLTLTGSRARTRHIELYEGDLTRIAPEEAVNILVVSAFPNDHQPTPGSLIGALARTQGISVADLAHNKRFDLTRAFSCWLSKDISAEHPNAGFKAILCFEPLRDPDHKPASALVGNIFRSLLPIVYDLGAQAGELNSIAMPLLAAGDQGNSPEAMMTALFQAAAHWFELEVPIDTLKIVEIDPGRANAARQAFEEFEKQRSELTRAASSKYDVFISYAHEDSRQADEIQKRFRQAKLRVFMDRLSIDVGSSWQACIFEAMDACRKVVTLYSPDYLASAVCQEELNVAYARQRKTKGVMVPLYLRTTGLPTYLELLKYIDGREGTSARLDAIWPELQRACQ